MLDSKKIDFIVERAVANLEIRIGFIPDEEGMDDSYFAEAEGFSFRGIAFSEEEAMERLIGDIRGHLYIHLSEAKELAQLGRLSWYSRQERAGI